MQIPLYVLNALDNRRLNLIILPTEKCNLRCSYCYEDFKIGKMRRPVINGVKAWIRNRLNDLYVLDIEWFGGEPLLAIDVIEEISEHVQALRSASPHLTYAGSITTNGYLLNISRWARLVELGITAYQISLDGEEDTHNKTRHFANQRGTFKEIWDHICDFQRSNLQAQVLIRVHFSPDNYNDLDPLIEKINAKLGSDSRFRVFFKAVGRLGGPHDDLIRVFEDSEEVEIANWLYRKLENSGMAFEEEAVPVCYASQANSFVIRANGDIAKCTVALNDERNRVGYLKEDGSVIIDNDHFRLWLAGLETGDRETLACPYSKLK